MALEIPQSELSTDQLIYQIAARTGITLGDNQVREIIKEVRFATGVAADPYVVIGLDVQLNVTGPTERRETAAALRRLADIIDAAAGKH